MRMRYQGAQARPNGIPFCQITVEITYASKHIYDWPHHPGDKADCNVSFLAVFTINLGKNCWHEADEKSTEHSNATQ